MSNLEIYNTIKSLIRPFDLIFFRGSDFVSGIIAKLQYLFQSVDTFTHVGIVIDSSILKFDGMEPNTLYIWESTMSGFLGDGANKVSGQTFGVQVRKLADVIENYKNPRTKIAWAKMKENPLDKKETETELEYVNRLQTSLNNLQKFYDCHKNAGYDYNPLHLLSTLIPNITSHDTQLYKHNEKFFCSELCCAVYICVGVLDKSIDAEETNPMELFDMGLVNKQVIYF